MAFRVQGLEPAQFAHLIGLPADELAALGVERRVVDSHPGFPDRIEIRHMEVGETALLLNYEHQSADTPYRSRHAIFVGERSTQRLDMIDEIPAGLLDKPISLRAFDEAGMMLDADLVEGGDLVPVIERFLADPNVAYLHVHYAKFGCYAARIVRT